MRASSILQQPEFKAKEFFLKRDSYFTGALPEYFDLHKYLVQIDEKIQNLSRLSDLLKVDAHGHPLSPANYQNVNHIIYNNKDGRYAWRALELAHPVLYTYLVNLITRPDHWQAVVKTIKSYQTTHIETESMSIISSSARPQDEIMISNWHHKVEQETITLALDFRYLAETDIANCYGDFDLHTISQVFENHPIPGLKTATLGPEIVSVLAEMQSGRTIGLPQSGELMNFLAEIILSAIDYDLEQTLKSRIKGNYHIIRYRDDYRIFTNSHEDTEIILQVLNDLLRVKHLRLNTHKTKITSDIITHALKEDKYHLITEKIGTLYLSSQRNLYHHSLLKEFLALRAHAKKFPQSGTVTRVLAEIYENQIYPLDSPPDNVDQLIPIVVDMMLESPRIYNIGAAIIGKLLLGRKYSEKFLLLEKIKRKFQFSVNTEYLDIWLQRLTLLIDRNYPFPSPLCQKLYLKEGSKIWNSNWLKDEFCLPEDILDEQIIADLSPAIPVSQVKLFTFDDK